ncbi:Hypothetical protein R9X50_00078000 [Acrodontium crateriforme]|uniref:Glycoside hydrolase n=1 Tax=Acrodontium crateriforme TaxID=150365 RepID=A0AAQ3M0W4_9PEZI|nr:Hypothetical protein R9X50_00078000 [Acrodontium crateriforme]
MKAGLFAIAGLSAVAVAQPAHRRHQHLHKERDVVTKVDWVTEIDYATATAANVVVYVDEHGNPISTAYASQAAPTQAASKAASSIVVPVKDSSAAVVKSSAAPSYSAPAYSSAAATKTSSAAPSYSSTASSAGDGYGITYSPYRTDGTCKSQDDVNADFARIPGYGTVRTYGTDCNQVAMVLSAMGPNRKLFAGIFDINSVDSEAQIIINAANGDWSRFDTISVGNEGINDGTYTISQVSSAVQQCKSKLSGAGYTGPVITVDTFVAILAHPELCSVGDYVGANCHAFFDGGVLADAAGAFVVGQAQAVSAACGGKKVVITESGWPSAGNENGVAKPSEQNQQAAIASLKSSFSSNLFIFNAFNDYWKKNNSGTFNAEWYWGIFGDSASCTAP